MGLTVKTDGKPVTVYAKERQTQNGGKFTTYCLGVASKDKDGNWVNGFIDCQFKKDVVVNNKAKIDIRNSFFNVSEYNGKKYVKLFIMEFDVVEQGEAPQQNGQGFSGEDFMNIPDNISEELPFQ